jgi:two-component system cell cycle response regulator CtrA
MRKSEGVNRYTTELGEEGVDLGKLYDYVIILLDLNLPDMSGFEVLRSLRVPNVETPHSDPLWHWRDPGKGQASRLRRQHYITKPLHKDELVARIHAIVRRS